MARVLLFGRLADIAGWRERDIPARTLAELRGRIAMEDPALFEALQAPAVRTAVDQSLVSLDVDLGADSEVAFLPPMSGG
ncbi:MoaD/ThiS family protein [Phenylobacterium parvum]|uniref:Molybdopterin synthase sulfur carrier subunit n=1 Tax=Phenylobacterium parvum TaxID=2201350 RepID=A0A2Z3HY64_9CAUL|nr:MoaD/ThiS family protein [Phenylobacterium parvum]AWM76448.1 molybdopterin synthase sulfur carrier subunit [Phenylobacterium parvum]